MTGSRLVTRSEFRVPLGAERLPAERRARARAPPSRAPVTFLERGGVAAPQAGEEGTDGPRRRRT